jgi:hypothetical protein
VAYFKAIYQDISGNSVKNGKDKGKVHSRTGHEGPKLKSMYSFTLSFTLALDGGQRHAPAALPPGKTRYLLYRWQSEPQDWYGRVRKTPPYRDAIPGLSSPLWVAIPTTLSRPTCQVTQFLNYRPFPIDVLTGLNCPLLQQQSIQ